MNINFDNIKDIFRAAEGDLLLEHEVYQLLHEAGIDTPEFRFIPKGEKVTAEMLSSLPSEKVVLKIISPLFVHKSDISGVRFVPKNAENVNEAITVMLDEVPLAYRKWIKTFHEAGEKKNLSINEIKEQVRGVLVCEAVDYEKHGLGSEILIGIRTSREFGPIVTMGLGGVDVEYLAARFKEGRAVSIGASHMLGREEIKPVLESLAFYEKLVKRFRGRPAILSEEKLFDVYDRFLKLGAFFSPYKKSSEFVIVEAEVNPFVVLGGKLIPLDGMCRFSKNFKEVKTRPYRNIKHLLKPKSIGIIGVSEKKNLGHIILNNVLKNGFSPDKVIVVKPGIGEIEGCRCVPAVADIPGTVDMFVLAVSAKQSSDVMRELVRNEKARSVIIIAGGIGEKEGTEDLEQDIQDMLAMGRIQGKMTPVVNGGNCLGIFSRPGFYDTTFVSDYKLYALPRKEPRKEKLAFISQSGAFMISRMSKLPYIEPAYAVSIGNQIDLTLSDYLNYFKDEDEIRLFAVYAEGFLYGDGLAFVRAARELTQQGKTVLVYKAGRSPEGKAATASHTASVAGDYLVNRAILEQSGVIVAEDIFEFEMYIKNLVFLSGKKIRGNRVGLISNAGFECVIMSDSLTNDHPLELARLSIKTEKRIKQIIQPLGIDRLQDIHNPVDITPVADDKAFCGVVEAMLDDPGIDCAVISPLPMSSAMQTLLPGEFHKEDLFCEGSTARRIIEIFKKTEKPFVVSIDTGEIYQPMVDLLEEHGVPVFRHSDEAVRFLRKFIAIHLLI